MFTKEQKEAIEREAIEISNKINIVLNIYALSLPIRYETIIKVFEKIIHEVKFDNRYYTPQEKLDKLQFLKDEIEKTQDKIKELSNKENSHGIN